MTLLSRILVKRVTTFIEEGASVPYYLTGSRVSAIDISYAYGAIDVITRFSLELADAERVLVVGRNGSGKTTLANILSGHLPPSTGKVVLPACISSITLPLFFPPIKSSGLGADPKFLRMFHLSSREVMDSYPDQLSAGQQQKLALALALSQEADLYILDEPLANLDAESRSIAMNAIFERTRHKALIVIMHGAEEYDTYFDRVVRLEQQVHEFSCADGKQAAEFGLQPPL